MSICNLFRPKGKLLIKKRRESFELAILLLIRSLKQCTKLPIALRYGPDCIVSSSYQVFRVKNSSVLFPEYLMLWLSRTETQRRCGFNAWGSTRDVFPFSELCKLEFPIPPISIQKNIVDIYNSYLARKQINEKLKQQLKDICPILIRGSLKEAKA